MRAMQLNMLISIDMETTQAVPHCRERDHVHRDPRACVTPLINSHTVYCTKYFPNSLHFMKSSMYVYSVEKTHVFPGPFSRFRGQEEVDT